MFIEVKNYVIYYNLSYKVIDFIISINSKLAIRDTEPTVNKEETYTREDENGETITERFEQQVIDTSVITEDEYKHGYLTGLEHCTTNDIKYKWLDLYSDMSWYNDEKTALTAKIDAAIKEDNRQAAINSNFEYNGKTYYGDQRGREALLGTVLIGAVGVIKSLLTEEQITQLNTAIQIPYADVNNEVVTFGVMELFEFATKFMESQQNATLGLSSEKK